MFGYFEWRPEVFVPLTIIIFLLITAICAITSRKMRLRRSSTREIAAPKHLKVLFPEIKRFNYFNFDFDLPTLLVPL